MNIDKIEKMDKFPSFFEYLKESFFSSFEWIFIFFGIVSYFFSIIIALVFILTYSIFEYSIDKRIFKAFRKRGQNDSN
jgi:hypothetical protein